MCAQLYVRPDRRPDSGTQRPLLLGRHVYRPHHRAVRSGNVGHVSYAAAQGAWLRQQCGSHMQTFVASDHESKRNVKLVGNPLPQFAGLCCGEHCCLFGSEEPSPGINQRSAAERENRSPVHRYTLRTRCQNREAQCSFPDRFLPPRWHPSDSCQFRVLTRPRDHRVAYELPSVGSHWSLFQQAAGLEFGSNHQENPCATPLSSKSWISMYSRRAHQGLYEAPELFHS